MCCRVFATALCFLFVLPALLTACKDFPNPFAQEKSVVETLQFQYSINFVASGVLAEKKPHARCSWTPALTDYSC